MSGLVHDFQVVILPGGKGRRMHPLNEDLSKGLLPVANRPLISYPLELLERAGFRGMNINELDKQIRIEKIDALQKALYKLQNYL
jgi:translation initiation factor eIF-2B subunit gamma